MTISPKQFQALTRLQKSRSHAAEEACRLVMVEGLTLTEAARQTGLSLNSVNNAHKRFVERLEWSKIAAAAAK